MGVSTCFHHYLKIACTGFSCGNSVGQIPLFKRRDFEELFIASMVKSSRFLINHLFKGDGMNQQNHFCCKTVASVLPCQSLPYRVIIRLTTLWLTTLWLTTLWLTRRIDGDMSALLLWLAYGGHGPARKTWLAVVFSQLD